MTDAHGPGWREVLIRLSHHEDYSRLPASVRVRVEELVAMPEVSTDEAESLLAANPGLRELYRQMHQAPTGDRGEVLVPASDRKRPEHTWKCPVPACTYEDWGDRFHPAHTDYCPRTDHPRSLLTLAP